ncbi:MAG TPA: carboxypeptidase-like regulatory domain-containing protein [Pyrinomonadaceae bacterium]|nr:carboxypeptidase-like regulatory domain-containing protein [Pyrinomonadaceae bacterium]
MLIIRSGLFISLLLIVAGACLAQDKHTGSIKGKVKVETGSPSGVAVTLLQGDHEVKQSTTDKKGEFVISRVNPGTYSVRFRKAGLSVGTIDDVLIKAGETRTFKDLILSVDAGSLVFIRGSVFDEGGRSVPNVRVELERVINENSAKKLDSRITGETGEFVFRLPPDVAKYRVSLKADGAEPSTKDVDVENAAVYRVALTYKRTPK